MPFIKNAKRLLCLFSLHHPIKGGVWNNGLCFTRCENCRQDLVRTAMGKWHIPKGYKVVWKARPAYASLEHNYRPEMGSETTSPETKVGEAAAPRPAKELPIQEVIRELQANQKPDEDEAEPILLTDSIPDNGNKPEHWSETIRLPVREVLKRVDLSDFMGDDPRASPAPIAKPVKREMPPAKQRWSSRSS